MSKLENLKPERVFYYFEQISSIARGSGNMDKISKYCIDFAKNHNLRYYTDELKNVVIFKDGSKGYENSQPVILQGHLDMVCQKTADCDIDFENDGLDLYIDGDFVKAKGTTLGADNGIAVAMALAILESDSIAHPPIEAVFTVDEETGMYGAHALDMSILKSKRLINMDSEEDDCITVSCAGGADFVAKTQTNRKSVNKTKVVLEVKGLKGGHSGVEINSGRLNANIIMGKALYAINSGIDFDIISINGGDKPNAITNYCCCEICVDSVDDFKDKIDALIENVRIDAKKIENDFCFDYSVKDKDEYSVLSDEIKEKIITTLSTAKNGVLKMSDKIENLVETSLNLGILKTDDDIITIHFSLRSNTKSGLSELEEELKAYFKELKYNIESFGHYPPWEYKEDSELREIYKESYKEMWSSDVRVEALHAGLECGIFASQIENIDCIAVGPTIFDVHTVNEKLSISSTENFFAIILKILAKMQ